MWGGFGSKAVGKIVRFEKWLAAWMGLSPRMAKRRKARSPVSERGTGRRRQGPPSKALPGMSENPLRRTDKIRTTCLLGSQSDDNGGRVGQSDLPSYGGPARQRRTLQAKEQKNATKKAFNGAAYSQFPFSPSGRQTGAVFLSFGIPRDNHHRTQDPVNPGDEMQAPIGSIQTDDARTNAIQMHRPRQQWLREGSIMDIGGRQEKKEW